MTQRRNNAISFRLNEWNRKIADDRKHEDYRFWWSILPSKWAPNWKRPRINLCKHASALKLKMMYRNCLAHSFSFWHAKKIYSVESISSGLLWQRNACKLAKCKNVFCLVWFCLLNSIYSAHSLMALCTIESIMQTLKRTTKMNREYLNWARDRKAFPFSHQQIDI